MTAGFGGAFHPRGLRGPDLRRARALLEALPGYSNSKYHIHEESRFLMGGGSAAPTVGAGGLAVRGAWAALVAGEPDNLPALRREMVARRLEDGQVGAAALVARVLGDCGAEHALERLEGDLSFVALDAGAGALWLSRGRAGAWPLYLAEHGEALFFSTHLRALLTALPQRPSDEALLGFMARGHPGPEPAPGLRALAPGELLRVQAEGTARAALWRPGVSPAGLAGDRPKWARSVAVTTHLATVRRAPEGRPLALLDGGGVFSGALARALDHARRPYTPLALAPSPGAADELDALIEGLDLPPADPELLLAAGLLARAAAAGAEGALGGFGGACLFHARLPRRGRRGRLLARLRPDRLDPPDPIDLAERLALPLTALAASRGLALGLPLLDPALQRLAAQVPAGLHAEGQRALFVDAMGGGEAPPHQPPALDLAPWIEGHLADAIDAALRSPALPPDRRRAWLVPERVDDAARRQTWRALAWARWRESLPEPP